MPCERLQNRLYTYGQSTCIQPKNGLDLGQTETKHLALTDNCLQMTRISIDPTRDKSDLAPAGWHASASR